MTKAELLASLHNETKLLIHLAGKVDPTKLDYRPTPKQRSTGELLGYLSIMGPLFAQATRDGAFDGAAWGEAEAAAKARDLGGTLAVIGAHGAAYEAILADVTEAQLGGEIEMFGDKGTRDFFMVNTVIASCAAYRMQLFLYLKSSGQEELNSMNLWVGTDGPTPG